MTVNIPDEAVEAVAQLIAESQLVLAQADGHAWTIDRFLPAARRNARRYLEAAAPHLQAQALRDAADERQARSETFLSTMQNMSEMIGTYSHDDIIRYGAYSAEAQTTAAWLRARADRIEKGEQ
jgi:hypothetical protein